MFALAATPAAALWANDPSEDTTLDVAASTFCPRRAVTAWPPAIALWVLFTILQVWRARLEEKKLSCLPGYSAYCARTGFFLPSFSALR